MKKIIVIVIAIIFIFGCEKEPEVQDPNRWVITEPDNPILYIGYDILRLQAGSSIKYIEIGDPNIIISYFEPNKPPDLCIEMGLDAPEGFIIKGCYFNIVPEPEPNEPNEPNEIDTGIVNCTMYISEEGIYYK